MSDHVKYLGVIIDKNLNWSQHINMIAAKANSASNKTYLNAHPQSNPHAILHLFAPLLNMPVLSGHHIISKMYSNWKWCSGEPPDLCQTTTIGLQVLRKCYITSNGILWRLDEITFTLYYYIKLLTNWWTSLQRSN